MAAATDDAAGSGDPSARGGPARSVAARSVAAGAVAVRDVELAWRSVGEGPPLLLVHGFTGCQDDWSGVVDDLAARGRRVVTYDHRGHGDSSKLGDEGAYTFDALIADLDAFVDATGIDRFDLLGHSMGGMVAMRWALDHQDRLRSLVLMDTAAEPAALAPAVAFFRAGFDIARQGGMQPIVDLVSPMMPEEDRARVAQGLGRMDPAAFVGLGEELLDHEGVLGRLGELGVRTTVLVGESDVALRPASDALAGAIPGAVLVVIPDAAHSPQVENRTAWLAAVAAHLDG